MQPQATGLFDGIPDEALAQLLSRLEQRRFAAGSVVVAEGDAPSAIYVILSGNVDVLITDRQQQAHRINQIGPGETFGEMSLLTGMPVSATVRTTSDTRVAVLHESDLSRVFAAYPRLYRNLGAILSERLAHTNRRAVREGPAQVTVLHDEGAPPLLAYALACSVAWHTRRSTVLLRFGSEAAPDSVRSLAMDNADDDDDRDSAPWSGEGARANLLLVSPTGAYGPEALPRTIERLCGRYDYVLVHQVDAPDTGLSGRRIRLQGATPVRSLPRENGKLQAIRAWQPSPPRLGADQDGVLAIPTLSVEDERALAEGLLPPRSAGSRGLGWAARDITGLKVGLALGAGSIKGYAHIGVLRILEQLGIPIDCITGTSIGAAVAACYALGFDSESIAETLDTVGSAAFRLTVPRTSLLSSAGLRNEVKRIGGDTRFEDLRLPAAVVAADIATGREVIFRRGHLWPAVLASMSIPGIYPPQRSGSYMLVDGGVLNPVPSNVAADLGANVVIAVKLASRATPPPSDAEAVESSGRVPSVIQAITRSIEMMQSKIVADSAAAATIQIEPAFTDIRGWGLRSFRQGRQFVDAGIEAAEAALPRIEAALPWLRCPPDGVGEVDKNAPKTD